MPAFGQADLSNCEREQIHLAGSIQPHGALLFVREPEHVVIQASTNAPTVLQSVRLMKQPLPPNRAQGATSTVRRGDMVLVRTGQLGRVRRLGDWGGYAAGDAPGLSFTTLDWLHRTEIAAIASDTWGLEVRPYEFTEPAMSPLHQIAIPNMGLPLGEMWDLEELATDCAADGVHEFLLVAAPLPVTGAVGAPVNPIAIK